MKVLGRLLELCHVFFHYFTLYSDDHLYNRSQVYLEHDDRPDDVRHDSSDFDGLSKDQQKFFTQVSDALEHEILKSEGPVGILKQIQYFLTCVRLLYS